MLRQKQFQIGISEKLSRQHTPLKLSPSFRIKFLSPYRLQIQKTQTNKEYNDDYKLGDDKSLLKIPKTKSAQKPFKRYQTPNYEYFKKENSDSDQETLHQIINIVRSKKDYRVTLQQWQQS